MNSAPDAYLAARLSVMVARLVPAAVIREMIDSDLDRIHATLARLLPGYQAESSPRLQRKSLHLVMYRDFETLLLPFSGVEHRLLIHAIRWFELVNLKVIVRGKFAGISDSELTGQLIDLGDFADLPVRELIETDDPFEMLRRLEDTAYGDIVRQARKIFEEQGQDLFSLDAAIDRKFFVELVQRARFLDDTARRSLTSVIGALLDRFNLLWLMRYRFSYGLAPSKSYYLLTASGPTLTSSRLLQLARLGSVAEMIDQLPPRLKELLSGQQDMFKIEQLMEFYSLNAARRGLGHQHPPITRLLAYVILREAETRYLVAILKGKAMGFDNRLIEKAVGMSA